MSALLYIGGVLYLLAVIRTTGKRFDADFISWQEAMKRATYCSVLSGKGTYHVRANDDKRPQVRA